MFSSERRLPHAAICTRSLRLTTSEVGLRYELHPNQDINTTGGNIKYCRTSTSVISATAPVAMRVLLSRLNLQFFIQPLPAMPSINAPSRNVPPPRQQSKQPKNTIVKKKPASVADRGLSKRTRGRQAHEENIRQHERAAVVGEQRILNRPSHMRHVEVLRTGHNVISNQVFTGREGKPPPQPRAKPPMPVWDRLAGQPGHPAGTTTAAARLTLDRREGGGQGVVAENNTGDAAGTSSQRISAEWAGGSDIRESGKEENRGSSGGRDRRSEQTTAHHAGENSPGAGRSQAATAVTSTTTTKPAVPPLDLSRQPTE